MFVVFMIKERAGFFLFILHFIIINWNCIGTQPSNASFAASNNLNLVTYKSSTVNYNSFSAVLERLFV